MKHAKNEYEPNSFVAIGGSLGGILLAIILLILIFAKDQLVMVITPLIWGFVAMAIVLGFLQYKSISRMKSK